MNLSRHFTLAELTRSQTAERENIPNQPGGSEADLLRALCAAVLDPLREAAGQAIKVNSGYRGPALNRRIGGSTTSQHMQGKAADIQAPGMPVVELFKLVIRLGLPFDQVIYEAQNANTKWVHVSHNPGANRGEIRVAEFGPNGRPTGYPRISAERALAMSERATRSGRGAAEPGYIEMADEPPHDGPFDAMPRVLVDADASVVPPAPARARAAGSASPVTAAASGPANRKATAKKTAAKKAAAPKAAARRVPAKQVPATKAVSAKAAGAVGAKKAAAVKRAPVAKKAPAPRSMANAGAAPSPRPRPAPAGKAARPAASAASGKPGSARRRG